MNIKLVGLNTVKNENIKAYKVKGGKFYIDGEEQPLTFTDKTVASYDVTDNEDYASITRDPDTLEVTVGLNVFVSEKTVKDFFSINSTDAGFPYHREDGKLVMSADIKLLEGLSW